MTTARFDALAARPGLKLATRAWGDFRTVWRQALAFHLVMQLLGLAVFAPLLSGVTEWIVATTGQPVISNYDIARFVLSPVGAAFVVVFAALATALLLAEFAGHTWIAGHAIARRPVTVSSTVAFVLRRSPWLIGLSTQIFLRLALLLLPFIAVAGIVAFTMLREQDINYYLAENPLEWQRVKLTIAVMGLCFAVLAVWRLVRWLYAVPIMLRDRVLPRKALAASVQMTRGHALALAAPLVLWWLALTGVAFVIAWVSRQISDAGLVWAGIEVQRVLPLVALYLAVALVGAFLYSGLQFAGQQFLVTRMYAEQRDAGRWVVPADVELNDQRSRSVARSAICATLALVGLALAAGWFMATRFDFETNVAITAHRGASMYAPENTMAAFRIALDAGANYVELDVQHTRDGQHRGGARPRLHACRQRPAQSRRADRGRCRYDRCRRASSRVRRRASAVARRRDRARARQDEDQRRAQVQRAGPRACAGRHRAASTREFSRSSRHYVARSCCAPPGGRNRARDCRRAISSRRPSATSCAPKRTS